MHVCYLLITFSQMELKEQVIHPIEAELGRKRSEDKYAPRTIDIDIVLFDEQSCNDKFWKQAFVVVPLAEIHPEYQNPLTQESILETATRLRQASVDGDASRSIKLNLTEAPDSKRS